VRAPLGRGSACAAAHERPRDAGKVVVTGDAAPGRLERIVFLPTAALTMHWVNRPTTQGLAMFGPGSAQLLPEPTLAVLLGAGVALVALAWRRRTRTLG